MIYFAYGSNLDPGQMVERCPGHRTLGVARLPGHRLCFPRFSPRRRCAAAGFEPAAGDVLWGVLYQLAPEDIPVLHYHEGYDPAGPPEHNHYQLEEVTVHRLGSGPAVAMTYVAVPDETTALPSAAYLEHLIVGARYHGLPKAYVAFLARLRTEPEG